MIWFVIPRPAAAIGLAALALAPEGPAATQAVHPGYRAESLLPPGFEPSVGGLDWWPDGRLAVLTMLIRDHDPVAGPSDLFLLDHVLDGNPAALTLKKYATGFHIPTGVRVVDGKAYVLDNRDGLYRLDEVKRDSAKLTLLTGKGVQGTDRKWAAAFGYNPRDGYFYLGIGVFMVLGGMDGAPQPPLRGTLVRVSRDGSRFEPVVGGLRQPNGMTFDSRGELFTTDNQGSWLPAGKVLWGRPGTFYGHPDTPLDSLPVSPPALWVPYGELSNSPSELLELPDGPYAGQFLMGEVTNRMLLRVGLEKVRDAWQGCVFKHSWDFPAGPNRLLLARDGSVIVGSAGGNGGWVFGDRYWDLQRLVPTGVVPFEMKMIRSKGPASMEIEFTKPVAAATVTPAAFAVQEWWYRPTSAYGGPKQNVTALPVSSATLSPDGKRVTLELPGLKETWVAGFTLRGLKSAAGDSLWSNVGYYTLNKFGPGTDHVYAPVPALRGGTDARGRAWSLAPERAGRLRVRAPGTGGFALTFSDPRGRTTSRCAGTAGSDAACDLGAAASQGLLFWEGRSEAGLARGKVVIP